MLFVFLLIVGSFSLPIPNGTDYHYYCIGNCDEPATVTTSPGVVLMGGGPDVDMAFQWMISKCEKGDFLVIRTDDDPGYNQYIYDLGTLNSVATLVLFNREASFDPNVEKALGDADCLFMAGGDQWTYYSFWKDSPVSEALNDLMNTKGIPIGGTSAGMESSGEFVNTAQFSANEDLTSAEALANPYNQLVTIGDDFLELIFMQNILTDAHFEQRDRMGRLITFVARLYADVWTASPYGIACNEGTALLVDSNGKVSIRAWESDGCAYFINPTQNITNCTPGNPLTFDNLDIFRACGNETNIFDLSSWSGIKGTAYQISANNGVLTSTQKGGSIY